MDLSRISDTENGKFKGWPWWRWVLTCLIGLGLSLSAYLGWHFLNGGSVMGCGGGSPCDVVLSSRWSAIAGVVPVSGLAAGAYLAMLVASFFIGPATEPSVRRLAWGALLVLAGAAAGSALWFTFLQKWKIGAFCPYCMATHITGLLLVMLVIWLASKQNGPRLHPLPIPKPSEGESTNRPRHRASIRLSPVTLALVGLALAGAMAASQVHFAPPASYRSGKTHAVLPALDPHAVPLIGSPDARYVVTLLFDYKCPHCQHLHLLLDEVVRRYGGKLAFALCPSPLSSKCNPYIPHDVDEFKDSCDLAKIGLAVWVANRSAFPDFDRWMFSFETGDRWEPRSLDDAKAKAVELVGQAKFDAAQADPWIDSYLQTSIGIYGQTVLNGRNVVPKMVFGSRWVVPEPFDADDLMLILQKQLNVPGI